MRASCKRALLILLAGIMICMPAWAGEKGSVGKQSGSTAARRSAPMDASFIDSMIRRHRGAIDIARQALRESSRPEIRNLANTIIATRQKEIEEMQSKRKQWYPRLPLTGGMGMEMGAMFISSDTSKPFDIRFIDAMISHNEAEIAMAKAIARKGQHQEIKKLAGNIFSAQESEISQMKRWREEWFKR